MAERDIQHEIRLALGMLTGVVLWRNNCGVAKHQNPISKRVYNVRYGLAPGSADLIGIIDGRFVAMEVKSASGRVGADQSAFLACVRVTGGFACVVRSVEDAISAVARCREGKSE